MEKNPEKTSNGTERIKIPKNHVYHKFPNGEAAVEVLQRVANQQNAVLEHERRLSGQYLRIFLVHDYISRALTMTYCNKKIEWFDQEPTPDNCSIRMLEVDNLWMKGIDHGYITV